MVTDNKVSEVQSAEDPHNAPEDTGRMFTQEEVNKIIQQRLAKVKEVKRATESEIAELAEKATAARNAELDAREQRISCQLYLIQKGYPAELMDALDTSDSDSFKQKADSLVHAMSRSYRAPLGSPEPINIGGGIEKAFSANNKHEPKQWPAASD